MPTFACRELLSQTTRDNWRRARVCVPAFVQFNEFDHKQLHDQ